MDINIRPLTIDDYDSMIRLWLDAGLTHRPKGRDSREMIEIEMSHEYCAFFGLFVEERMVGVAIANWDGRRGWVNRVAVHPDFRGQRLASQLIDKCEEFLRECGALVICALIEDPNLPSMSAFEHAGYSCLDEIKYFSKRKSWDD